MLSAVHNLGRLSEGMTKPLVLLSYSGACGWSRNKTKYIDDEIFHGMRGIAPGYYIPLFSASTVAVVMVGGIVKVCREVLRLDSVVPVL